MSNFNNFLATCSGQGISSIKSCPGPGKRWDLPPLKRAMLKYGLHVCGRGFPESHQHKLQADILCDYKREAGLISLACIKCKPLSVKIPICREKLKCGTYFWIPCYMSKKWHICAVSWLLIYPTLHPAEQSVKTPPAPSPFSPFLPGEQGPT